MLYVPSKEFPGIRHSAYIPTSFTGHTYNASFHLGIQKALLAFLWFVSLYRGSYTRHEEGGSRSRRKGDKVSEYF